MVNSLIAALAAGLLPQFCVLCGLRSENPLPLCQDCRGCLLRNDSCCTRCALPLAPTAGPQTLCGQCLQRPPAFARVAAPWLYEEHMAYLVKRWKFHGAHWLTPLLADLWLQAAAPAAADLVIPVPLHWRRQWRRGYNQSLLLAQQLRRSRRLPGPVLLKPRWVARARDTAAQSGLDAAARARNMHRAFLLGSAAAVTARGGSGLTGLDIAIVDDVMTTGATGHAIASLLRDHGARSVQLWCLARTPSPGA